VISAQADGVRRDKHQGDHGQTREAQNPKDVDKRKHGRVSAMTQGLAAVRERLGS